MLASQIAFSAAFSTAGQLGSDIAVVALAPVSPSSTLRGVDRFLSELQESWVSLASVNQKLLDASKQVRTQRKPLNSLAQTREQYERETQLLLIEPTERFARLRPIRRSLEAMQEFDRHASSAAVRARASTDERFQLVLAEAALDLCEPWRIRRSGGTQAEWLVWEKSLAKKGLAIIHGEPCPAATVVTAIMKSRCYDCIGRILGGRWRLEE